MSNTKTPPEAPRTGPRGAGSDVRAALIAAGCTLYEERGLDGVALREVADRAGVNQAMVRYYFKDKMGFEQALLDEGFDQIMAALPTSGNFEASFHAALTALNILPWLPFLMMRTVYVNASLRDHFIAKHAPRMATIFGSGVGKHSEFAALSALSLLIFPILARPVVGPVFSIEFDDAHSRAYASYVAELLTPKGE
jgi:TetR/AcrR family transcriptional regulator